MTPNKSDSGELREKIAAIEIDGIPLSKFDSGHSVVTNIMRALTAHIQAVGGNVIGSMIVPTMPRLPGSPESWKRYYEQNAQQELQAEQRKRLAQYLGKQQDEALHND